MSRGTRQLWAWRIGEAAFWATVGGLLFWALATAGGCTMVVNVRPHAVYQGVGTQQVDAEQREEESE